jgi:hypothetical protein
VELKIYDTKSKVMVVGKRIDREKIWKLGDNCIHETNEYKYKGTITSANIYLGNHFAIRDKKRPSLHTL